jgi:hypothetical protein
LLLLWGLPVPLLAADKPAVGPIPGSELNVPGMEKCVYKDRYGHQTAVPGHASFFEQATGLEGDGFPQRVCLYPRWRL